MKKSRFIPAFLLLLQRFYLDLQDAKKKLNIIIQTHRPHL